MADQPNAGSLAVDGPQLSAADTTETVSRALAEDVGDGDLTAALITEPTAARAQLVVRERCILCGTAWFNEVFRQLDDDVTIQWRFEGGLIDAWDEFLRVPALSMGVYALSAGADDPQTPHGQDEVYYVVSGHGVLRVEDVDQPVQSGSLVYVEANAQHHFHSISEDLTALVFFAPAEG